MSCLLAMRSSVNGHASFVRCSLSRSLLLQGRDCTLTRNKLPHTVVHSQVQASVYSFELLGIPWETVDDQSTSDKCKHSRSHLRAPRNTTSCVRPTRFSK